MADKTGQEEDYIRGAVDVLWVDMGDGTFAKRMAMGGATAAGGVKVVGRATITGPATLRAANGKRRSILIKNMSGGTLYIGPIGITTADGFALATGEGTVLDQSADGVGVDASASTVVHWLEEASV